ncbi:hypothetical protein AB4G91_08045 [Macrococcoides goetzii]|uniref:hypothetical protein n=1 Tax=Macrococcus epidermidis TaxID=1902580 RepID=UPI001EF3AF21|nr:hypothetical protein [Macrococcus epidermidis]MCG7421140.1 hypothetical protein [Macrococcus epidermidis]
MKKIVSIAVSTFILLAGCSNESADEAKKNEDTKPKVEKTEEKSSVEKKEVTDNSTETEEKVESTENSNSAVKDEDKAIDAEDDINLDEKTKIALAFFADGIENYSLNAEELLTGKYLKQGPQGEEAKRVYRILLREEQGPSDANNMKFYTVYPSKGMFKSVVGVSDEEIFVAGTQNDINLIDIHDSSNGVLVSTKDLYEKYKNNSALKELAENIEITDLNPMQNEATKSEFDLHESATAMLTAKQNMINEVLAFEGVEYFEDLGLISDDVRVNENTGEFTLNLRNQDLEKVATYKLENSGVVKIDPQGNKMDKGFK